MIIDRARLTAIFARERADFVARHPRSAAAYGRADHLFGRVPMTWMNKNAGDFPIYLERALTGRPKIAFNSYCYHGSVDESLIVVGPDGEGRSRPGNVGEP